MEASDFEGFLATVKQLQEIMLGVALGRLSIDDNEPEYVQLFMQVAQGLERISAQGLRFRNPNSFRSLWDWYGYWKANLPSYQSRRVYVRQLYDAIVTPIEDGLYQYRNRTDDNPSETLNQVIASRQRKHSQAASNVKLATTDMPFEIQESMSRFQADHPDPTKVAFIMMRFSYGQVYIDIVEAIRSALRTHGIAGLRADDKQYHTDLFPNVLTYIHGCRFGVAVFDRIEGEDFNPNVALEVGYMFALKRPVCLLKDRTLRDLHTDLAGKLYRIFDPMEISATIPKAVSKWLTDNIQMSAE